MVVDREPTNHPAAERPSRLLLHSCSSPPCLIFSIIFSTLPALSTGPIPKATPMIPRLRALPREVLLAWVVSSLLLLPRFAVDCTGHARPSTCIGPYTPSSWLLPPLTEADGREPDLPGWANPNNRRTLNERRPNRRGLRDWLFECLSWFFLSWTDYSAALPRDLIIRVESKEQMNECASDWRNSSNTDRR